MAKDRFSDLTLGQQAKLAQLIYEWLLVTKQAKAKP